MKRKYEKPTSDEIRFVPAGTILIGSVATITKDFTVKTDDYEIEKDTWASDFDIKFE